MAAEGLTQFTFEPDEDAEELIQITERWLRDVKIRAMCEAMAMLGVDYKDRVEILTDRFNISDRSVQRIVRINRGRDSE